MLLCLLILLIYSCIVMATFIIMKFKHLLLTTILLSQLYIIYDVNYKLPDIILNIIPYCDRHPVLVTIPGSGCTNM